MTRDELFERCKQKLIDGGSYGDIVRFMNYQEVEQTTIDEILERLKKERTDGNLINKEQVKTEREENLIGGIMALIIGCILLGINFIVLTSGWVNISLLVIGCIVFLGGLFQLLKHFLK